MATLLSDQDIQTKLAQLPEWFRDGNSHQNGINI
jgi:hypothetical protein